jgi:asparaginyl-tRNA synthetase
MFTSISAILSGKTGKVRVRGWISNKRSSGGIQFLELRDGTGFIQSTVRKDKVGEEFFKDLELMNVESVIELEGEAVKDPRAPGGFELRVESIRVLHRAAEGFPIQKRDHGPEYLMDNRHFYLRDRKMFLITKVRAKILELMREWFKKEGFTEVHVPIIVGAAVEGGSTLFKLDYFGSPAYLTQSWQFYGEAYINSVGKCYTLAPSFRAEKSRTRRHLTEFWHLEAEMPFCDMNGLMEIEESLVEFVCQGIAKSMSVELKELGRDPADLLKVKAPLPRLRYEDAIEILKKDGVKIEQGDDIGADEERILTQHYDVPVFLTHFPDSIKPFYHKPDPKNPKYVLGVDMLAPEGYGEIIGSGERITDYDQLVSRIRKQGLDPKDYQWYVDMRKWGSVPHAGFGIGIERFVMWVCKLEHVRDAIAFPRFINRKTP